VLLRVDDARSGREAIRRLIPHVDSAGNWWQARRTWLSTALSYAGLQAIGVPHEALQSFPEAFRVGMEARAQQLGDVGINDPRNWEPSFRNSQAHIGVSAFSDSEENHQHALVIAREQYEGLSGVSVLAVQHFGAQPGDLNSL